MERIFFAKVKGNARIPSKRDEDAGYDVYGLIEEPYITLQPHETRLIPTGIASACPQGYYFQLQERGSTGTKGISQRCGVIDSGYRGEWFLPITNLNSVPVMLKAPDTKLPFNEADYHGIIYDLSNALAQAVLLPVPKTEVTELSYDELLSIKSQRMAGSIGSSNK